MKQYNRIMLGKGGIYLDECLQGGFIGADYGIHQDLSNSLPENWRDFNEEFRPVYLKANPSKTKVAAGLACGMLYTMSLELQHSTGSTGTCCSITQYAAEIESLLNFNAETISCANPDVEYPAEFAMEKHLEDFLIKNWKNTPLGSKYSIYEVDGEVVGEQFQTDTGFIDILAISKDKKTLISNL